MSVEERLRAASRRLELTRSFGKRLEALRIQAGLQRGEIAERGRFSPTILPKTERGEFDVKLSQIVAIAEGLGVAPGDLLAHLPARSQHPDDAGSMPGG